LVLFILERTELKPLRTNVERLRRQESGLTTNSLQKVLLSSSVCSSFQTRSVFL